jgi:hypothetical protein
MNAYWGFYGFVRLSAPVLVRLTKTCNPMKSKLNKKSLFLALICLLPTLAGAQQLQYGYWDTTNHTCAVTQGGFYYPCPDITNGIVVIPSNYYGGDYDPYHYNGYAVTAIHYGAFQGCPIMTNVTIGPNVISVEDLAFYQCSNMKQLSIGNNVAHIGERAFFGCGLTYVAIPDSVVDLGDAAFSGCPSLTGVTFGKGLTGIPQGAFSSCISLASVAIPTNITDIEGGAFSSCSSLTSVEIGSGVTNIGSTAFAQCTNLLYVTIPDNVTSIGNSAFQNCYNLKNAVIGKGLTNFVSTFQYCASLTSVTIRPGAAKIGDYAFLACANLPSVTIPNSVKEIGVGAFWQCTSFTNVTIPGSVEIIWENVFADCTNLTSIIFLGNAPIVGNGAFSNVSAGAKVYYYYGTSGWGDTYGGLPTVMLGAPSNPPQIGGAGIGVTGNGFGFNITGVTNQTIVVESSTNLVDWLPVWTNILSGTNIPFADSLWTNYPSRFYRVR